MTASADVGEELQSDRVPTVHYLKTRCVSGRIFL